MVQILVQPEPTSLNGRDPQMTSIGRFQSFVSLEIEPDEQPFTGKNRHLTSRYDV